MLEFERHQMHEIHNILILHLCTHFFSEDTETGLVLPEIKFSCLLAPKTEISTKMTLYTLKTTSSSWPLWSVHGFRGFKFVHEPSKRCIFSVTMLCKSFIYMTKMGTRFRGGSESVKEPVGLKLAKIGIM